MVIEVIPKYAPELNIADGAWAYVKYNRLAKYAPRDPSQIREQVTN